MVPSDDDGGGHTAVAMDKVGLYRLNEVDPLLESAWLQPLSLPLDPS
jgi:hypothetical protein